MFPYHQPHTEIYHLVTRSTRRMETDHHPAHLTAQTMSSVSGIFVQTSQHIIKQTGKLEITQSSE